MTRSAYQFTAERDGKWWLAIGTGAEGAEAIRGPLTQGRSLDELSRMISDAISLMRGVPEASFDVTVRVDLPDALVAATDHARDDRRAAGVAQRDAVQQLRAAGFGLSDVRRLLGISYQRAAQIAREVDAP